MVAVRLLAAAILALLLAPSVSAQSATVLLEESGGAWNGVSEGTGVQSVWVPRGARLHEVLVDGAPGSWRARGTDAIEIASPGASNVSARFDVVGSGFSTIAYRAPESLASLRITLTLPEGAAPTSGDATFARDGTTWVTALADVPAQTVVGVRVVDADRVGELPVLISVLVLAALGLLAGLAWHRARPPLGGRDAERFLDHLVELQARILPPTVLFGALNLFFFVAGLREVVIRGIPLVAPTFGTDASLAARAFDAFAERLVPEGVSLVVLRPVDAVLAHVQMTLFLALLATLPLLVYELVAFIGPALNRRERRAGLMAIPLVLALFVVGALLGFLVMAPLMISTLYAFAPNLGAAPLLAVGDLISFTLIVVIAFGLAFELPVAMYALARVGVVRAATFRRYFRHAMVGIFLVAGIITPDPSIISQALVAVPVTLLYLLGMLTASLGESRRQRATVPERAAA